MEQYKQIKRIGFFGEYLKSKVMRHWKERMIRKKFNLKCKYIANHLFSQNMHVQPYLHYLHDLAEDYSKGSFFSFNINMTYTLGDFVGLAMQSTDKINASVRRMDELIERRLRETLEGMLGRFRSEERVRVGSGKKLDEAYLPFDSKRKSMRYTQMAKLK